jgi:hypothetical protein
LVGAAIITYVNHTYYPMMRMHMARQVKEAQAQQAQAQQASRST